MYKWKPTYLRTGCCCTYENRLTLEPGEFEKNKKIDNRTGSHQPNIHILENQSGSHNIMREPEPADSHEKVRTMQQWFEPGYVHVEISLLCHVWLQNHAWCQKSMWFSLVIKRNQPMLWCFACMVAKQHLMTKHHAIKLIINKYWPLLQNYGLYAFNITTTIINATKFPSSKWSDKFFFSLFWPF
jgi:hypothetical protein